MPGLYVHVPFCERKCAYCDFYSLALPESAAAAADLAERYLDALERELYGLPAEFVPDTVYVGGGTPTVLRAEALARLADLVHRRFRLPAGREWSCEANPGTLTAEKVARLRAGGVNRVSLGVQSLDDRQLAWLGRRHTARQAADSFQTLRAAGFDNLSVDLIYALPGITRGELARDLEGLLAWQPEHVSVYALSVEPGTPLAARRARGDLVEMAGEEQAEQYHLIRRRLLAAGYEQYEISNFARPGRACRHNLNCWDGGDYFGCGPAAHSHWLGCRSANVSDLESYAASPAAGRLPRAFTECLEAEAKARETLILNLRRTAGVEAAAFRRQTGFGLETRGGAALARALALVLLERHGDRLRLSAAGLFVSDAIFAELV
ncbi:MAG: radical SAM family heme chaperone HemW [Kiritimatiellaeota bacterium]|nr:radical SAM family heme chaperone HemW [Kiritimatiellota bacterium]